MGSAYEKRAPRYILGPEDDRMLRFAVQIPHRRIFLSNIHDISATGLSFTTSPQMAPKVGESVGLEFKCPNSNRMACYGRVVRVSEYKNPHNNLAAPTVSIGVKFLYLPKTYKSKLQEGIEIAQMDNRLQRRFREWKPYQANHRIKNAQTRNILKNTVGILVTVGVLFAFGFLIAQYTPRKNSVASKSPWSDRFADMVTNARNRR